jgi:hypothetical protein
MYFLDFRVTSSFLNINILFNTLFSNTLRLRPSLNVSDQVSHPHKITNKIIVVYLFIFSFLDIKLEDRDSAPNNWKLFLPSACYKFLPE